MASAVVRIAGLIGKGVGRRRARGRGRPLLTQGNDINPYDNPSGPPSSISYGSGASSVAASLGMGSFAGSMLTQQLGEGLGNWAAQGITNVLTGNGPIQRRKRANSVASYDRPAKRSKESCDSCSTKSSCSRKSTKKKSGYTCSMYYKPSCRVVKTGAKGKGSKRGTSTCSKKVDYMRQHMELWRELGREPRGNAAMLS